MNENTLLARDILERENCTCVLVDGGRIVRKYASGISPILELIGSGEDFSAYSAADKIVGKAAALLYLELGVKEVYGEVMAESAEKLFKVHGIAFAYSCLTPHIINRRGDGPCPMEETVSNINDPEIALSLLRKKLDEIKNGA